MPHHARLFLPALAAAAAFAMPAVAQVNQGVSIGPSSELERPEIRRQQHGPEGILGATARHRTRGHARRARAANGDASGTSHTP